MPPPSSPRGKITGEASIGQASTNSTKKRAKTADGANSNKRSRQDVWQQSTDTTAQTEPAQVAYYRCLACNFDTACRGANYCDKCMCLGRLLGGERCSLQRRNGAYGCITHDKYGRDDLD